jgi:hypothetical protein
MKFGAQMLWEAEAVVCEKRSHRTVQIRMRYHQTSVKAEAHVVDAEDGCVLGLKAMIP